MPTNPYLSNAKTTESSLHAALHPLVLLTISDYVTRHALRGLTTPIVGAIIGQQEGREITIEHAYDLKTTEPPEAGGSWRLDETWFEQRLQQYKDVHKTPPLDLVGWWTISSSNGPSADIMEIHHQVMKHNESALLLTFHPEAILQGASVGGKLPLTIYESVYENVKGVEDGNDTMQVESEGKVEELDVRLRELRYEIATGEAEMISVDFVARGGGNATAIEATINPHTQRAPEGKGKSKVTDSQRAQPKSISAKLNPEEEEMISFLTSRANAIKMLHSRITAIKTYLNGLPTSYVTTTDPINEQPSINHESLRAILALAAKLPLVVPPDANLFAQEQSAELSNMALVKLLADISRSVQGARNLGNRFAVAEANRKGDKGPMTSGFELDQGTTGEAFDAFFQDS